MSISKAIGILLPAVLASLATCSAPAFLPGSGVGLELPPGVTVTTGLPDFKDGRPFISIMEAPPGALTWFPGLGERTQRLLGANTFEVGGAHGLIARGTPDIGGRRWRSWTAFLEAETESVTIQIGIPEDDGRISSDAVEAALRTIKFRDANADRMAALPFTVAEFEGFRPITLGYPAAALLKIGTLELTQGPFAPNPFAPQPTVWIRPVSRAEVPVAGRNDYARRALLSNHIPSNVHIVSERVFDDGGAQWSEIKAVGEQLTPVNVVFFMRFGVPPSGVISIICTSLLSDTVDYSDRFRRLALSVRPKG